VRLVINESDDEMMENEVYATTTTKQAINQSSGQSNVSGTVHTEDIFTLRFFWVERQ